MSPMAYTEDTLVQQTTAAYLEQQLGWRSVYAYNTEDFGTDSLLGRHSDREVVPTRTLRAKLVELNPSLPDAAYDDSVGEPKKILARNHQFLGVNRAVAAVRDRKGRDGKLGVFGDYISTAADRMDAGDPHGGGGQRGAGRGRKVSQVGPGNYPPSTIDQRGDGAAGSHAAAL